VLTNAGFWASMWHPVLFTLLTTPLLVLLPLLFAILASLKVFDQIYILLAGGPNYTTRPVIQYIFDTGFTSYRGGYAAAATMVYLVMLVLISAAWFLLRRRRTTDSASA
jgi:multiple sugar transport system permease protein